MGRSLRIGGVAGGDTVKAGQLLIEADLDAIKAAGKPATTMVIVTNTDDYAAVEQNYGIEHAQLVGGRRNKELMEPRHVGIWLTRELTDNTLADIGKKFGGRSHATVKHSIYWVEKTMKEDRIFQDKVQTLKDNITDSS